MAGFPNYYSALQNSNQVYALVVLVVLLKLRVRLVPSFIDVRRDSFGIYLTHQIVGSVGRAAIDLAVGWSSQGESFFTRLPEMVQNPFARIGIWVLWFGVVYTTSLVMTILLRRTSWAWTVGENSYRPPEKGQRAWWSAVTCLTFVFNRLLETCSSGTQIPQRCERTALKSDSDASNFPFRS